MFAATLRLVADAGHEPAQEACPTSGAWTGATSARVGHAQRDALAALTLTGAVGLVCVQARGLARAAGDAQLEAWLRDGVRILGGVTTGGSLDLLARQAQALATEREVTLLGDRTQERAIARAHAASRALRSLAAARPSDSTARPEELTARRLADDALDSCERAAPDLGAHRRAVAALLATLLLP